MKLAACYSVFNNCELLHGSIKQIHDHVDVIIISFQEISNVGNFMSQDDIDCLKVIASIEKVIIIEFKPDTSVNPKVNERRKLQERIDFARDLKCTHYFGAACDHYYKSDEFLAAKAICVGINVDVTFTKMFTYYKEPTYQLKPIEDYLAPFICRIYYTTKVVTENNYKERVDPSVRISPANSFHTFDEDTIMLHHYSMVRNDIESKFNNAAAAQNWPDKIPIFLNEYNNAKAGDIISYFNGRKIIEVENYFNIQ